MKILYVSDIHASVDNLNIFAEYAKKTKPDMMIIAGDLVNFGLSNGTTLEPICEEYHPALHQELFNILANYAQHNEPGLKRLNNMSDFVRTIPIIAEKIYQAQPNNQLEVLVEKYLSILDFAEGNMDIQYDLFKDILDRTGIEYYSLPGNYDKDLQETKLKENDLHKKTITKDGLKISGFGGANDLEGGEIIARTPLELTVQYKEYYNPAGKLVSEAFNFLIKEKPDIAFTHIPPRGIRDFIKHPKTGELIGKGSPGLTQYITQGHTNLLCCGHMHGAVGLDKIDTENEGSALVFNGGTLKQGYFAEISINDKTKKCDKIDLYQIKGKLLLSEDFKENLDINNVKLLMQYLITNKGELKKIKLDFTDKNEY